MRKALLAAVAAVVALAGAGQAQAALTATEIRIGNHPAFVRVVVDFTDGRLRNPDLMALDPMLFADGRSTVEISRPGIDTDAAPRAAFGVRARLVQGTNRILLRMSYDSRRFKYLGYAIFRSPERLVVDLWRARPPVSAAVFTTAPQGGCLTLDSWSVGAGTAQATGTESGIFENMFSLGLRGVGGRAVRTVGVTSSPSGNWSRTFSYSVAMQQAGTLEAVDFSAKDGSLICIAQVRVTLRPPP